MNTKTLDILIPVYNEDKVIVKTIQQILENTKCDYLISICYDYDQDPTLTIINKNFPNNNKINFVKNFSRGFNNALKTGINKTYGDAVMFYMADDHENYMLIDQCYERFIDGYDLVCPSRFIKGGKMEGNPFLKELLTRLASFFFQYFSTLPIKDSTNAFRLFSRKVLNSIENFESIKGFTLSFEITSKAHRLGCTMTELPSVWRDREVGYSKFKLLSFLPPYIRWLIYITKTSLFHTTK
ncbi:glycosyltransferase family 2 protein [Candidatus Pelagibacter bacterium nBUS_32]|uniref:glycosyltransferase family 2 protein n=1 Tax=Candidatus Pelagibacter bacterium nBUS_32 TaxID=3374192 RepID=UPI003EB9E168